MREIKFRAWVNDEKRFIYSDNPPSFSFWKFIAVDSRDLSSLMQFTGLYDKNGMEIYEGDLIEMSSIVKAKDGEQTACFCNGVRETKITVAMQVVYNQEKGCYWLTHKRVCKPFYLYTREISEAPAVGNIHENKDLLD